MPKAHPRRDLAKKILTWLFFIFVIVLLVVYTRKVDWENVLQVIVNYKRRELFAAMALVLLSYLLYGCYDLIGQAWTGHRLARRQVILISAVCYAVNLTLSTWVGGVAMRYRLYARLGLSGKTITHIFSLSIATNWLGYVLLAGITFSIGTVPIPQHWFIGAGALRLTGFCLLAFFVFIMAACAFARPRVWVIRGHSLTLPSLRMALLQLIISCANWMLMATIIWLLLAEDVSYLMVLGVLLISSIVGVIVHIPAGIGVLETVFLALLSGEHAAHSTIIAALLAYRVLYYILPLLLALTIFLWMEGRARPLWRQKPRNS